MRAISACRLCQSQRIGETKRGNSALDRLPRRVRHYNRTKGEQELRSRKNQYDFKTDGYPDVELTHFYADNAAYQLARDPCAFDVILADNLFGDILSDQAGAIAGSLGMMLDHSFGRRRPRGASRPPSPQRWTQGTARRILAVRRRPRA